jgi:hypothetical protein
MRAAGSVLPRGSFACIFARVAVFLLLLSVGGLETLAKSNEYLPASNPSHYLSIATKLNVGHPSVIHAAKPLPFVSPVVPEQPAFRFSLLKQFEEPHIQQISLAASLRHRSPPALLL